MRKAILLFALTLTPPCAAQVSNPAYIAVFSNPSGLACGSTALPNEYFVNNTGSGATYYCNGNPGHWTLFGSSGVVGPTGSPGATGATGAAAPVLTVPITTNLATTVAGNPNNATIIPAYNYNETLTSTVTMSGTNLTLQCVKGTTFTKGSNNPILSITGTNITIDGCTFDGAEAGGFTGNVINISVSSGVTIKNSTFKNVAGAANAINGQAAGTQTGLTIGPGNTFSNVLGSAFYGDGTAISGLNIHDNVMDCSQISSGANSCIASHTSISGQTNKNTRIANNQIIQGAGCYAIEVGSFTTGAVPPDTVSITGNKIQRTANAACGGISVSTATNVTESLNTVDNGGFTYVTNVFEFVGTSGSSFTGNVSSNDPVGANNFDLSISGTSGATVQSNIFQGGIFLGNGSGTTNLHNDSNVVEGNTITLPAGATYDSTHPLIWLRCNAAGGCTVNNNRVMGNAVTMTGATVQYGIYLDNDFPGGGGGSVDSNNISSNGFIGTFGTARFGSGGSPTNTTDDGFVTVTGNGIANITADTTAHITASTPITDAVALSTNATLGQNLYFYRAGTGWVQQLNSGGGGITYPAGTGFAIVTGGAAWGTTLADPLPVAHGGSGTASPGLVAGTNVTITGSWPNQTVNSSGGGGGGSFTGGVGVINASNGSGSGQTTAMTDNGTTIAATEPFSSTGSVKSGVGSGIAGSDGLLAGTLPTFGTGDLQVPTTNAVGNVAPTSLSASYIRVWPNTAPAANQFRLVTSNPSSGVWQDSWTTFASTNLTDTANLARTTVGSTFGAFTYDFSSSTVLLPLGTPQWGGLGNPSNSLSLGMGSFQTTFTYGAATSTANMFLITDTASNTGTGYLFRVNTATSSSAKPFFAGNNGNGVGVNASGALAAVGTGTVAATSWGGATPSNGPGSNQVCVGTSSSACTWEAVPVAALATFHGSCTEVWGGSGTSFALTSGDDAIAINACYNDTGATRTITAVKCLSDNGSNTTTVNPTFGASGTGTTILSGALTCGSSNAMSSTGTVSNASWTTGAGIAPAMSGTLTGTHIVMIVEYSYAPF